MKTALYRILALLIGIEAFDFLFYKQLPGLNVLLFSPLILILILLSGRRLLQTSQQHISILGFLIAAIAVALSGSVISILAYLGAACIMLGFNLEPELKSLYSSSLQSFSNFFTAPLSLITDGSEILNLRKHVHSIKKIFKIIIIPVILFIIFTTLFRYANPLFNHLFYSLDVQIRNFLEWLDQYLSIGHLIFLLFTGFLLTGILYRGRFSYVIKLESGFRDDLVRERKIRRYPLTRKPTALKDEYQMGVLIFITLNVLLLVVNITEIFWLNGEYRKTSASGMSQSLHDGTGLLILSIILSIGVMLTLFRKNLNFYSKNAWLIRGAYIWILQNAILGIHVAMINLLYISQYGLTYKRIGIFFFLVLVVSGLIILYIKIRRRKSIWFLAGISAWSFYFAFLLLSIINWDTIIISYNLRENAPVVDVSYLLNLPQRGLKLLDQNRLHLFSLEPSQKEEIEKRLDKKIQNLVNQQEDLSWRSQNFQDFRVYKYFKAKGFHH